MGHWFQHHRDQAHLVALENERLKGERDALHSLVRTLQSERMGRYNGTEIPAIDNRPGEWPGGWTFWVPDFLTCVVMKGE